MLVARHIIPYVPFDLSANVLCELSCGTRSLLAVHAHVCKQRDESWGPAHCGSSSSAV